MGDEILILRASGDLFPFLEVRHPCLWSRLAPVQRKQDQRRRPAKIDWSALIRAAREVRSRAYAPYSEFRVGAAVLGASGRIFSGCNVENSSYGLTLCAERNAVGQAVANGERRILAAVIAGGSQPCPPCGMCRQVFAEFAGADLPIAVMAGRSRVLHQLGDLLPHAFDKKCLTRDLA
jgi:cytidine deaminase